MERQKTSELPQVWQRRRCAFLLTRWDMFCRPEGGQTCDSHPHFLVSRLLPPPPPSAGTAQGHTLLREWQARRMLGALGALLLKLAMRSWSGRGLRRRFSCQ